MHSRQRSATLLRLIQGLRGAQSGVGAGLSERMLPQAPGFVGSTLEAELDGLRARGLGRRSLEAIISGTARRWGRVRERAGRAFAGQFSWHPLEARQLMTAITPIQQRSAFYQGTGTLTLPQVNNPYYVTVADAATNASTVVDTANGGLIGLASSGAGRVAVIGNTGVLTTALRSDPATDSWARGVFNLYEWLAGESRTVGQTDTLHVLRASDTSVDGGWGNVLNPNHAMFLEFFATETNYIAADQNQAVVSGTTTGFTSVGTISEALLSDGAWSRRYGVVELPSNADQATINLVEQWMTATGGGVLIDGDTSYSVSTPVQSFLTDVGLNLATQSGPRLDAGNYTPSGVDPKDADYVFRTLSGVKQGTRGQTVGSPIILQASVSLPGEIPGATVSWATSNAAVLSAQGVAGTPGDATLTATLRYLDGTTATQTLYYKVFQPVANTGVELRKIDTTNYKVNGQKPSQTDINAYLTDALLSQTPASVTTDTRPSFTTSSNPDSNKLWVYSAYLMPTQTGTYGFKLAADDSARVYIEANGSITSQSAVWWGDSERTLNLEAGKSYRVWAFFKPGGGTDTFSFRWKLPNAADYTSITAGYWGKLADGLLPANAGYPTDLLPWASTGSTGGSSLSTTQILSQASYTALVGNQAPAAGSTQEFNFATNWLFFQPADLRFTNAIAAQVQTLSIRLVNADGTDSLRLVNQALTGVTSGASLATAIQAKLNAANAASGSTGTITVSYSNNLLTVTDTDGRKITDFILTKAGSNVKTVSGAATYGTGRATLAFNLANVHAATRLSLTLSAAGAAPAVGIADLMFQGVGYGDPANIGPFLQNAVRAQMGNDDVSVAWDGTNNQLVFTDSKNRPITFAALTDQSAYVPLIRLAGPSTGGNGAASKAVLGGISGRVLAEDANADSLTYTLLQRPQFGTVTLDAATGQYFYQPTAGGPFQGFDQFAVSISDGKGGTSGPVSVRITSDDAPAVSIPIEKTFTVPDPVYTEPAARPEVPKPADFVYRDVFIAQTHVQRPNDPYLQVTANRSALIKFNATSASGAAAPDFVVTVTDRNGNSLGSLRLTGPANLPTAVNLPSMANYGQGSQSNDDSYVAPLPGAWVQPGITIAITAAGDPTPITSFQPRVGPDVPLTFYFFNFAMYGLNDGAYMSAINNWGQQALAHLPIASMRIVEFPYINVASFGKEQSGVWGTYTGDNSGLPGSDPLPWGGGFQGIIGYAIHMAGQYPGNSNNLGSLSYVAANPEPYGGLGGGRIGGGGPSPGIFWHELAGHGMGRGHAASDSNYPYNGKTPNGASGGVQDGWLGPNWGYNQFTGVYQPTSTLDSNGKISLYTDPQAGGYQTHPGNNFGMFSDYYSALNAEMVRGMIYWMPDDGRTDDGGFAGEGYYKAWDNTAQQWVVLTPTNYQNFTGANVADIPVQHDAPAYWLTMNLTTPQGNGASPGSTYAENLKVMPVRIKGELAQPFRDILTGAGRAADGATRSGDYVARITYATATGLITDHLIIPSSYGNMYLGFNVPDKGELVRVDIVEAANADVAQYLKNKVVASYVNSEALANTVFKGNASFSAQDGTLALPQYWNGAKVTWSSTVAGLVNLSTGAVDGTKIGNGSALRAQWVENGVLQTQSFVINLPDTAIVMNQLFGQVTNDAAPADRFVISTDLTLKATLTGATVAWVSSNPAVVSNTGQVLSAGDTTLTATVTFASGAVRTYAMKYRTVPERSLTTTTPYVMNQLIGTPSTEANLTAATVVTANQSLPTSIDRAAVVWSSSDPAVINAQGTLLSQGFATLTATVTFDTGAVKTYSVAYYAVPERALTTATPYVMNQLFGRAYASEQATLSGVQTTNLTLPTTIDRATVVWSSSAPSIVSTTGQLLGRGTATLTATVTFDTGAVKTYALTINAVPAVALTTSTPYVTNQLFGRPYAQASISNGLLLANNLTLPSVVEGGTVTWSTSDRTVLNAQGQILDNGTATLTATVTFTSNQQQTFSMQYKTVLASSLTTGGLLQRIIDVTDYEVNGSAPDRENVPAFLSAAVLDRVPIFTMSGVMPAWNKDQGQNPSSTYPTGVINGSGQLINSLWTYSGFLLPTVDGTYTIKLVADDAAQLFVSNNGVLTSVLTKSGEVSSGGKTLSVDLKAGQVVPIWLYYRPGGTYWPDTLQVTWQTPESSSFSTIPASQIACMPTSFVPANAGFPAGLLHSALQTDSFNTNLGLQLRVVDLTGFTYSGSATGFDRYLSPQVQNAVPIFSGTAAPNYEKGEGVYGNVNVPDVLRNSSGYVKESLWTYTGYLLPQTTGTYTFSFRANDEGRIYLGTGSRQKTDYISGNWTSTLTMDLTAGEVLPIWISFKTGAPDSYWADLVRLQWKTPGSDTLVNVPLDRMAPASDDLIPANAGYPSSLLPSAGKADAFNSGVGLNLRIVDLTDYTYSGNATGFNRILTSEVFAKTPLYVGTAVPNFEKGVGAYGNVTVPDVIRNASGQMKKSLWTYSGYLLPTVTGTYTISFTADDEGRMYLGAPGAGQKVVSHWTNKGNATTFTVDLKAGEVVPMWVFFQTGAPDSYWGDWVKVQWKQPGAGSFTDIPADRLAPMPADLLPADAGYPAAMLPTANQADAFQTNLGLQLRVVDLTGFTYSGNASGLDQVLTSEILGRTPIYNGTSLPFWEKPVGAYGNVQVPDALRDANGQVKQSLWAYSGYLLPTVTGTYTFSFQADDYGRMYVGAGSDLKRVDNQWDSGQPTTVTMNLTAGKVVPLWVFFENGTAGSYWGDWIRLQWKTPGSDTFTSIPLDRLAPLSDTLVSPTGGYPMGSLPFVPGDGLLQLQSTTVSGSATFTAVSTVPTTVLPSALHLTSVVATQQYVNASRFEATATVPTLLGNAAMNFWVRLLVRQDDGTLGEQTPDESWRVAVAGRRGGHDPHSLRLH